MDATGVLSFQVPFQTNVPEELVRKALENGEKTGRLESVRSHLRDVIKILIQEVCPDRVIEYTPPLMTMREMILYSQKNKEGG